MKICMVCIQMVLVTPAITGQDTNHFGLFIVNDLQYYQKSINNYPQMKLIPLEGYVTNLKKDIKYARSDNFMNRALYKQSAAFLRKQVADQLELAAFDFAKLGLGILVYDAYRPYSITIEMWNGTREKAYVANPRIGSRHNRGAALDITLYRLSDQQTLDMGTDYDAFVPSAAPTYGQLTNEVLNNRKLLFDIMKKHGFTPHPEEWWHFDYQGYADFPITDLRFEDLE